MNMIMREIKEIDKKILKYYHDYRRIKGSKFQFNREAEQKINAPIDGTIIKIED